MVELDVKIMMLPQWPPPHMKRHDFVVLLNRAMQPTYKQIKPAVQTLTAQPERRAAGRSGEIGGGHSDTYPDDISQILASGRDQPRPTHILYSQVGG